MHFCPWRFVLTAAVAVGSVVHAAPLPLLQQVRPIRSATELSEGTRPAALLAPAAPEYRVAEAALIRGLAAAGVKAESVSSVAAADPAHRTVFCLGSMMNNPLLERLYWNRYTFVDALTPAGPAGSTAAGQYLLQVVYDPYPYNGGHNVVVIGCHDAVGAQRGVRRVLELVRNRELPYVVEVGPGSPVSAREARAIVELPPTPTLTEVSESTTRYLKTGCEAYARRAIAAMDVVARLYAPGGSRTDAAQPSYYARLPWNEETHSWEIACAWDDLEECPLLDDSRRLQGTNVLLQFTRDLVSHVSGYDELGRDDSITWNHTTFPMLGINFGARYFERYARLPDMAQMRAKARACFLAQGRSWKPKEDADTYMSATMLHTALYCLAENEQGYLTGGNLRRYADYVVSIGDNLGRASGFGDSNALATDPRLAETVLPVALWTTGDGAYRWLMDRFSGGSWANPYDTGVRPVPPDRLTGVKVFPLDSQLYAYTQARPFYSEAVVRAEVPASEAFDKIAFRENWNPDGQYLLLDGFARGKHLHYDGNSIVEFVEGGERWLIDHDYYIQNTTEHTMLSILRDGRCAELEPSMSGLGAAADLPGWGYTRTYVRNYNACDWQRQVLWHKGGWFLVSDTVTPRQTGEYAFDLNWKMIDDGSVNLDGGGNLAAERGTAPPATRRCSLVDDPDAPAGKALQLEDLTSQVACGVDLPAGRYAVALVGDGEDRDTGNEHGDCLRLSFDDGPTVWVRLTDGKRPVASPTVMLTGTRTHLLVAATSNVHAPMRLQSLVFTDDRGRSVVLDATHLAPPPAPPVGHDRRLWIKPDAPCESWITRHHPEGIAVPVAILHQRRQGTFRTGEPVRFVSLVFVDRPQARRDLSPRSIAPNLVAVQGADGGLELLGPVDAAGIHAVADAASLSPTSLAFGGLREFKMDGVALASSVPIALRWNPASGEADAEVPQASGAELTVTAGGSSRTVHLSHGHGAYRLGTCSVPSLASLLSAANPQPGVTGPAGEVHVAGGQGGARPPGALGNTDALWIHQAVEGAVDGMRVADLGDGQGPRLLAWGGHEVASFDKTGQRQWVFRTAGTPSGVATGRIRSAAAKQIVVGASDTFVYLVGSDGRLIDKRRMHGAPWNRAFGDLPYAVCRVGVHDLQGKGRDSIVACLGNSELQAFDAEWRPLWTVKDFSMQGCTDLAFADLDGSGRSQAIIGTDKYGYCEAVDFSGHVRYRGRNTIGDATFAVVAGTPAEPPFVVTASSGGDMMATGTRGWWGAAGGVDMSESQLPVHAQVRWRFDNYGYAVNRLISANLGVGRSQVILVASASGYVYALDQSGRTLWTVEVGRCVNDVLAVRRDDGTVTALAADESGRVAAVDSSGRLIRRWQLPAGARRLVGLPDGAGENILVGLADGSIAALGGARPPGALDEPQGQQNPLP